MKRKHVIIVGLIALILLLALCLWHWSLTKPGIEPKSKAPPQAAINETVKSLSVDTHAVERIEKEKRQQVVKKVMTVLSTPIVFYGKVIDQNGKPVSKARIGYGVLDKFNEPGSNYHNYTNEKGYFEMSGIRGAVVTVTASKEGYYYIEDKSSQSFAYGIGPDSSTKPPPTKDNPAVFVLQKKGETEPLIRWEKNVLISRTGSPVEISLSTGQKVERGDIRIEAWTKDQEVKRGEHHDWKCRISVPGGGLIERTDKFAFEAPSDGYKPFDEIVMSRTEERWQPQAKKEYFVKLPSHYYARLTFYMIAQGDHFFEIDSYLNPSGSRNLEYDPTKQINP